MSRRLERAAEASADMLCSTEFAAPPRRRTGGRGVGVFLRPLPFILAAGEGLPPTADLLRCLLGERTFLCRGLLFPTNMSSNLVRYGRN